jgi:glycosyltransferase involved in cell wall biosynthesis
VVACSALNVCTIIAKNYVAQARVLARSFAAAHPGDRLWTLVIDDHTGYLDPSDEPFELLTPADIGCEPFTAMALRYSVIELSTAVKPWLLRHLMGRTGEPVTYLDPDIRVFSPLTHLEEQAREHGVVLTPHNLRPIPQDGRSPSQVDIMIAGIYNLGYVSLAPRPEVDRLLDWWAERLLKDCRVDPIWGYFVDQRWFDLAPGFVTDLSIVRRPEYNIAYWNLQERDLQIDGDGYRVDGAPLAFFHFSGFDPRHPTVLSRHQDRIDVAADPALTRILGEYATATLAEGYEDARDWPYSYAALGDGTRLDVTLRGLYDGYAGERGEEHPSPFTVAGAREFEAWCRGQAPSLPAGVNRTLAAVYERRQDLWSAYTTPAGVDGEGLRRWAAEYGIDEEPDLAHLMTDADGNPDHTLAAQLGAQDSAPASPAELVRAGLAAPMVKPDTDQPRPTVDPLRGDGFGVNVVGYFRSEAGTGEAARQIVAALDAADVPLLPVHGQTIPVSRQNHPYETAAPEEAPFPLNLICMNADMLPEFVRQAGSAFFSGRYSVGLWFWEVSAFPEQFRDSFSLLEEVWAPTAHIAAALAPLATVPVTTVRVPVSPGIADPGRRTDLGLDPEPFQFLFSFDYLSIPERKNPLDTVAAFREAFAVGEGAQLVLKCINAEREPQYHARLTAAAAEHADIHILDRYLSPEDNRRLPALCDCYVSLHRAEGFGLVLADAMWQGKPVIATGYSGNLDFMTADNSLLVDHELVPIGLGHDPYPANGVWAQPDVAHAARLMRQVFDDRDAAGAVGARAAADIRRSHSPQAAGEILAARLDEIRATGRTRPRTRSAAVASPALAKLPRRIRQGPAQPSGTLGAARGFLRDSALRAMRPFTAYQQDVNRQIADALSELGQSLSDVRRDAAGELAQVLAHLRGAQELVSLRERVAEQDRRIAELERRLSDPG